MSDDDFELFETQDRSALRGHSIVPSFYEQDEGWKQHAACIDHPTNWWFPERGELTERAKIICFTCDVRLDCLNYSLNIPNLVGIWGGMSGRERREIVGRPDKPIKHGTAAGYAAHLRRKTKPCDACRVANSDRAAEAKRHRLAAKREETQ